MHDGSAKIYGLVIETRSIECFDLRIANYIFSTMRLSADGLASLTVRELKMCLKARGVNYRFVCPNTQTRCVRNQTPLLHLILLSLIEMCNSLDSYQSKYTCKSAVLNSQLQNELRNKFASQGSARKDRAPSAV